MQTVKLISITPNAEKTIAFCARVSAPGNQQNTEIDKLLAFCIKHGHWSIFEMGNMVLEINTTRAIAPQILRHRSFSFQEFSQRYAVALDYVYADCRAQDTKNRQNSNDTLSQETKDWWETCQRHISESTQQAYEDALAMGIAKECARAILPLNTASRIYMNGSIRSWIHYLQLRTDAATQKEHRDIALQAKAIFCTNLPTISKALNWS
jgi:thymidylate synthase (FAD)